MVSFVWYFLIVLDKLKTKLKQKTFEANRNNYKESQESLLMPPPSQKTMRRDILSQFSAPGEIARNKDNDFWGFFAKEKEKNIEDFKNLRPFVISKSLINTLEESW